MRFFSIRDFWSSFRVEANMKEEEKKTRTVRQASPPTAPTEGTKTLQHKCLCQARVQKIDRQLSKVNPNTLYICTEVYGKTYFMTSFKEAEEFYFSQLQVPQLFKFHERYECLHFAVTCTQQKYYRIFDIIIPPILRSFKLLNDLKNSEFNWKNSTLPLPRSSRE